MADDPYDWYCFFPGCSHHCQSEEAAEVHSHGKHGVGKDEVRRCEHYGTKEEKALYNRQRDIDIEDATRGFAGWLDSIRGVDDFLIDVGEV